MSAASTSRRNLHFLTLLSLLCLAVSASDELQTLLSIKTSLQSPTADVFNSWKPTNRLCNFTGIACNPDDSVNSIDLSNQQLTGSVPFDSICQLPSLETLALGKNSFSGPISDDVKNCVRLKYLDIGNNFFSGTVPDLSSLSRLEYLYLNSSGFSGKFPWNSISNMTGLVVLSVGDNRFDRTLFPDVVVSLTKLNWLYMANCSIEGKIPPEIGNLTELVNLELSYNYMSGEIPPEISKLSKLWQLELYGNGLTGNFPVGFGNLTSLEKFDASRNYLEGDLSELRTLNKLVSLQLYKNEFSGEVPEELGHFEKLVNLSLYENKLTGSLPERLGSVSDFNLIDASENFLTGRIPPEMCKQGKMTKLLLIRNKLSGEIPSTYANCMSMTRFRVSNNSLSGEVPTGIWGLPNVDLIDIALNRLEGQITSDIGNAKSLTQIFVDNNQLSGELPPEISKATGLIAIDLSDNQFSGNIPETIGELKLLNRLHLQNNMFSGPIPDTIGNCVAFNDINMAHNSLSGEIPVSIGSLPVLNSLNLSENTLSGQIPVTLSSLRLSLLDLSNNRLTGPIPQSLSHEAYGGSFAGNNGLCSQNIKSFPRCSPGSGGSKELRLVILCVALGAIALLLSVLCMMLFSKKSQKDEERSLKEDSWDVKSFHVLSFTEDEIIDSIKEENLIGKGGSGNVYRVVLSNGKELAVKHIWNSASGDRKKSQSTSPMLKNRAGKSQEFDAEVQTLSSIRHVNVVKLYCSITGEDSSLLVYEYLPNGSLWDRLHTCRKMGLDWETRYEIAVGAAKGLEYLHHSCERPVIHRDVKSSNILLDEFLKPRIADFGLAKIVQANTSKDSTHVVAGTHGYIAPEYGYTYKVNEKSDVYSFGVVLMELVTGKRPIEPEYGDNRDIVNWASNNLKSKESVLGMVDSTIQESYKEEAIKVLRIAILCTARLPALRPTMRSVVQMLEEADPCRYVGIIVRKNGASEKEEVKDSDKA
ncbi:Receptor-like protein kinase [Actinidia chinensis var. chinensis]|uniref:non-specific serine/threonine protein kinase n=1 Tax=Actinidia chinensis var. chinensis TaxID=1590841 RepID=A0A2R6RNH0_ACTCC|nr:Receptor-like protein kinase [Actinidia chinensis var. chinensis]